MAGLANKLSRVFLLGVIFLPLVQVADGGTQEETGMETDQIRLSVPDQSAPVEGQVRFGSAEGDYDYAWLGADNQIDPWTHFRSTWRVRGALTEPGPSIDLRSDPFGDVISLHARDGVHLGDGPLRMSARQTPPAPPGAGDVNVYVQDGQVVFQYNDGDQVQYASLPLMPAEE